MSGSCGLQIRILRKKVQQIEGLEVRGGSSLDAQQLAKVAAKPLLASALALLEQGTPLPEVQALLAGAREGALVCLLHCTCWLAGGAHCSMAPYTSSVGTVVMVDASVRMQRGSHCSGACASSHHLLVVACNWRETRIALCRRKPGPGAGQQLGQRCGRGAHVFQWQGRLGQPQARGPAGQRQCPAALRGQQAQASQGAFRRPCLMHHLPVRAYTLTLAFRKIV